DEDRGREHGERKRTPWTIHGEASATRSRAGRLGGLLHARTCLTRTPRPRLLETRPGARPASGMFLDLFYGLRDAGVPVAVQEWRSFLEALEQGLHGSSLLRFYHLGRACLIKSETY